MIDDKSVEALMKEVEQELDKCNKLYMQYMFSNKEKYQYWSGKADCYRHVLNLISKVNKKQSLKGFSSAVYGKKVAKEAKKNPKKAGKKMEQAFRNML